jgi:nucleotide-binding universal stress UspA family protein
MIILKNILVATDFSDASTNAVAYAREMARAFDATLHLLHVTDNVLAGAYAVEGYTTDWGELQRDVNDTARAKLDDLIAGDAQTRTTPVVLSSNSPAQAIVSFAKEARIDLIIVGSHGRGGMAHLLMGSVAERVVRTAACPVLAVRQPAHAPAHPEARHAVTLV